jgi:hypothetical protein
VQDDSVLERMRLSGADEFHAWPETGDC